MIPGVFLGRNAFWNFFTSNFCIVCCTIFPTITKSKPLYTLISSIFYHIRKFAKQLWLVFLIWPGITNLFSSFCLKSSNKHQEILTCTFWTALWKMYMKRPSMVYKKENNMSLIFEKPSISNLKYSMGIELICSHHISFYATSSLSRIYLHNQQSRCEKKRRKKNLCNVTGQQHPFKFHKEEKEDQR